MKDSQDRAAVRVICHVVAPADCGDLAGAVLRVSIEDVSLADAPSVEVARVESVLSEDADLDRPAELRAALAPNRSYALRAHVSRSGETRVATGDLITVTRHVVSPDAPTAEITLRLAQV